MGFIKLELRVPGNFAHGKILTEPDPYWTLDSLISELNSFQIKSPLPPPSSPPSFSTPEYKVGIKEAERTNESIGRPFMMCISDDDDDDDDDERDIRGSSEQRLMMGARFSCSEADFNDSEESDYELGAEQPQVQLMDKKTLAECYLFELERENQLRVMTELKKNAFAMEAELRNETSRSLSTLSQLEKHTDARREQDRQTDKQYQRRIAEALDRHLSIVQRDHEQRSQIEEQRIKDDAALEDARKKEKELFEEKLRREMAEAEARKGAARIAEQEQQAALEAAKTPTIEPQAKNGEKNEKTVLGETTLKQPEAIMAIKQSLIEMGEVAEISTMIKPGVVCKAADSALKAAAERLTKHDKGSGIYDKLISHSDKEFDNYQRQIARRIRQLTGTVDSVITKSSELTNIMKDHRCPYPISLMIFAKKILNLCENPGGNFDGVAFAVGHVIVRVTAQVPDAMDFVLAELHKACIYTIPKYLQLSKVTSSAKDYHMLIGYRDENGKIESTDAYLNRIESYMKLFGALTQTEIVGMANPHGIKEGWAWLARFLNTLPANRSTAVALGAFLRMAGFALFQKYKSQFKKMLNVISDRFLPALKAQGGGGVHMVISELETYLEKKQYLKEPEGLRLEASLSSRHLMA